MINPIAFKKAASALPLYYEIPSIKGIKTESNASIPYGFAASARADKARAVIVLTFYSSSFKPCSMISTKFFKCGRTAHPIKIAIY